MTDDDKLTEGGGSDVPIEGATGHEAFDEARARTKQASQDRVQQAEGFGEPDEGIRPDELTSENDGGGEG